MNGSQIVELQAFYKTFFSHPRFDGFYEQLRNTDIGEKPFRNKSQPEIETPSHSTRNLHLQPDLPLWLSVSSSLQHAERKPTRNSLFFLHWDPAHSWGFSEQTVVLRLLKTGSSEAPLEWAAIGLGESCELSTRCFCFLRKSTASTDTVKGNLLQGKWGEGGSSVWWRKRFTFKESKHFHVVNFSAMWTH